MFNVVRKLAPVAAAALFALITPPQVNADTVLPPGAASLTFGTSVTGTLLQEIKGGYTATVSGVTQSGFYTEDVVSDTVTGKLDFLFQFKNTGSTVIDRVTVSNYTLGGAILNADYATSLSIAPGLTSGSTLVAGAFKPIAVDRSAGTGDTVGFNFAVLFLGNNNVPNGGTSSVLVVKTDATQYSGGGIAVIDGATANIPALGPATAPLPATASMGFGLLGGLGCLTGVNVLRRRRMA
jgi:hypothetical protein